ncbi:MULTISPECIES: hypothetical protein [unclassified Mycobacterium]|uniref:hypothetical protein n=1 Tax=unclassified Mycobacterium TaxID=2642494 RepID=UPI0029C7AC8B|nr:MULTISPECIES: hypothetical protein [unclassified Mycobacterium]
MLHPPDLLRVSARPQVKTPARCDDVVQQLRRSVAELLFHAFALGPGLFFASGTFSFCLDAHSLFLQVSGTVRRDLDGPRRAAA